jgi:hypothetical protein
VPYERSDVAWVFCDPPFNAHHAWVQSAVVFTPFDAVVLILIGLGIFAWLANRQHQRDRREYETWWREYREHERITRLQLAWRAGFRQGPGESEEAFVARMGIGENEERDAR